MTDEERDELSRRYVAAIELAAANIAQLLKHEEALTEERQRGLKAMVAPSEAQP